MAFNWVMDTLCVLQNDRLKLQGLFKAFTIKMEIITVGKKRKWPGLDLDELLIK